MCRVCRHRRHDDDTTCWDSMNNMRRHYKIQLSFRLGTLVSPDRLVEERGIAEEGNFTYFDDVFLEQTTNHKRLAISHGGRSFGFALADRRISLLRT